MWLMWDSILLDDRGTVVGRTGRHASGRHAHARPEQEPTTEGEPVEEETPVDEPFAISEVTSEEYAVVSVVGELDVATAPELRGRLEEVIDGGAPVVIADLLGVSFLDSTALGVLIGALKRSQAAGREFRIVVAEPRILKIFEITGLTGLFSLFPTVSRATAT